jgi:hypothetical protein
MPDGSIKHIRSLAHSLRDGDGNVESVGAIMDITRVSTPCHSRSVAEQRLGAGTVGDVCAAKRRRREPLSVRPRDKPNPEIRGRRFRYQINVAWSDAV